MPAPHEANPSANFIAIVAWVKCVTEIIIAVSDSAMRCRSWLQSIPQSRIEDKFAVLDVNIRFRAGTRTALVADRRRASLRAQTSTRADRPFCPPLFRNGTAAGADESSLRLPAVLLRRKRWNCHGVRFSS